MATGNSKDRQPFAPEPDAELAARLAAGEPRAMEEIVGLFFHDVRRYALAMLHDEERAHEALQDTFLRLVERHRLYQPGRPFRPWLFAVCRNCCLTHLQTQRRERARVVSLEETGETIEALQASLPRAAEEMMRREREREVLALLAPLPELNKTIILLHLFEDLTFRQIAAIVGAPAATVATTYYRTLAALRAEILKNGDRAEGTHDGRGKTH